jgi:hypothetical protein
MVFHSKSEQFCTAGARLLVRRSIQEEFVSRLEAFSQTLRVAPSIDQFTKLQCRRLVCRGRYRNPLAAELRVKPPERRFGRLLIMRWSCRRSRSSEATRGARENDPVASQAFRHLLKARERSTACYCHSVLLKTTVQPLSEFWRALGEVCLCDSDELVSYALRLGWILVIYRVVKRLRGEATHRLWLCANSACHITALYRVDA